MIKPNVKLMNRTKLEKMLMFYIGDTVLIEDMTDEELRRKVDWYLGDYGLYIEVQK